MDGKGLGNNNNDDEEINLSKLGRPSTTTHRRFHSTQHSGGRAHATFDLPLFRSFVDAAAWVFIAADAAGEVWNDSFR